MCFRPSPYLACRMLTLAEESARGDPLDENNPFFWDRIVLNLPGSEIFNPSMPWVCKLNSKVNRIAADFITFVDDLRVTGYSTENCWQSGRRVSSTLQHMGIQEAGRKR